LLNFFAVEQPAISAHYIGSNACKQCHLQAFIAWKNSDHAKSMAKADDISVLGDFNAIGFNRDGIVTEFFRRDDA